MQHDASEIWSPPRRRRLYLMRHADVEYFDAAGRAHRPETVPLTALGVQQARAAALALAGVPFDRAITSGLLRTEQTARVILAGRDVPLESEPRFREIETGRMRQWAGADPEQVQRIVLGALPADLRPEATFLAGETFASLLERAEAALGELLARQDWQTSLLVAHGVVNRVLLTRLLGAPLGALGKLEQDACCINLVEFDPSSAPLVRLINYTADNPLKVGLTLSTLEGLYRQFLQGRPLLPEADAMNFDLSEKVRAIQERVRAFVRAEVLPLEAHEQDEEGLPHDLLTRVRQRAREAGVWAPQLPGEYGGLGLDTEALCVVFEEAGYSPLGPLALHCAAPDEGNMHLLLRAATPQQRARYFAPLTRGETRSCFALTEPSPGAGSDPTMIRTRADRRADGWAINGRKWFTSGAKGAAFAIVAAVTDPSVPPRQGVTLFLVDAGTPGFEVVRAIPTLGSGGPGGHCEIAFTDCVVSDDRVLGRPGDGFKLMQQRLGPARLTHCMRWLGAARRALDVAVPYARQRQAFGKALAEHQAIQWPLADSLIEMHAARLMVLQAAWKLDRGDEARQETSICKVFVAEAVCRIIDLAIQVCGAFGISRDCILERLYRDVRAFRIYDGPSEVHRMVIARGLLREGG